ncbi:hypothetical protein P167DRAFT_547019 [Morchella conica CCBAS932]|uniref:Uncharacterized protein n=1 Tax=Morchella conica CCBAS932 TaxID=1392247 RepID=A0A3N4KMQ2_9PEZI|nr:hypothetical protein P167DRAFT_547019 [Morchella conica CCBAS932]
MSTHRYAHIAIIEPAATDAPVPHPPATAPVTAHLAAGATNAAQGIAMPSLAALGRTTPSDAPTPLMTPSGYAASLTSLYSCKLTTLASTTALMKFRLERSQQPRGGNRADGDVIDEIGNMLGIEYWLGSYKVMGKLWRRELARVPEEMERDIREAREDRVGRA